MSRLNFGVHAFEAYRPAERRPLRDVIAPANVASSLVLFAFFLFAFPAVIFWFLV